MHGIPIEKGYIATPHKQGKDTDVVSVATLFEPGSHYYSLVKSGSGLGWLKFPDPVRTDCLEDYLRRC